MQSNINQYFRAAKGGIVRPKEDIVHKKDPVVEVHVDEHKPNPFNILPIEMNARIAELLYDDDDIHNFMRCCRSTHAAIEGNGLSFWRRRFLATFEKPSQPASNKDFKRMYLQRRMLNFHLVTFISGRTTPERECLEAIRDIIVDSFSEARDDAGAEYKSANLTYLERIFSACPSLLNCVLEPNMIPQTNRQGRGRSVQPDPLLQTLQVVLTPQLMRLDSELMHWRFPDSQMQAYNFRKIWKKSGGLALDMEFVLHQVNFWRYHMLRENESALCAAYCDLDASEYPRLWEKKLSNDPQAPTMPGRFWKGSYAFLEEDDLEELRENGNEAGAIQDEFCAEGRSFQDLELKFLDEGEETWPPVFEHHLGALSEPKVQYGKTRASKRGSSSPEPVDFTWESKSFRFGGSGDEAKEGFLADGWLNTLPAQNGVPGWQRLTMMKYFTDHNGAVDYEHGLWAYEGVVLPGGKIIVGRWWNPDGDSYSGPFILWCVDTPALLRQHEDETSSQQL
ncbi:hypothetical protein PRZ48_001200 [Zasmidium cellare]|uniref:F-box domain-containing protein n=1 Tax=Zasmidium cellare TaxID=395010 RepID=A0ABR0F2F4_ZASCE|nr:hypothetical protein PRZ48_001200 [Zasmidium cellare]